ncbi:Hypothetical_protein [Hexamita inflata]|uniref:Hypothetical_protein n=1 Tax=Hexamita inflata TaxID=28002 RepID=A0AA86U761_9EUKA|nr:Hypothetical protein HINF_LOCUS33105 [Hexamita inflata]
MYSIINGVASIYMLNQSLYIIIISCPLQTFSSPVIQQRQHTQFSFKKPKFIPEPQITRRPRSTMQPRSVPGGKIDSLPQINVKRVDFELGEMETVKWKNKRIKQREDVEYLFQNGK